MGWLTKFVVVPACLAATGYYVVAPRVGGKLAESPKLAGLRNDLIARASGEAQNPVAPPVVPTPVVDSGPQVDVAVRPSTGPTVAVGAVEAPKPKKKRRRRKKPVIPPAEATPPPATAPTVLEPAPVVEPPPIEPPVDQGGSGGAATAGGTGGGGGAGT